MMDDRLLTRDPNQAVQLGNGRMTGFRTDQNNLMMQSGNGLNTMINSDEMRTAADLALNENVMLKDQLSQAMHHLTSKITELNLIKESDSKQKAMILNIHKKSAKKVSQLNNLIMQLREENHSLKERIAELQRRGSEGVLRQEQLDGSIPESYRGPVLEALKGHMQAVEQILRLELSSVKREDDREKDILEKLMGHIKKAEEILSTEDAEMYHTPPMSLPQSRPDVETPVGRTSPSSQNPLSPTGQRDYNESMENVLGQLQALRQQVTDKESALTKERMRCEAMETQLEKTQEEMSKLRGSQESHVFQAMERQRQEDDRKHKDEMAEMIARVEELTKLAAEKHQKHAFDEEPRYHSASNELKQQVTSLVDELGHKDRCLNEEKACVLQQKNTIEELQRKVGLYHGELGKARREAQSYINTVHNELRRKDTLYKSEKQKALNEKLQHDKCREELREAKSKHQQKLDEDLAKILSAEEAFEAKEREKVQLEQKAKKLADEVQMCRNQMETWKGDFEAEREAREQMHTERMKLQEEITILARRNKEMEEDLQVLHRQQLHAGVPHYAPRNEYPRYERGPLDDVYTMGPRQHVYEHPGQDEAGITDYEPIRFQHQPEELHQPQQATTENWCPKCQQTFPDYDTLTIHLADCID